MRRILPASLLLIAAAAGVALVAPARRCGGERESRAVDGHRDRQRRRTARGPGNRHVEPRPGTRPGQAARREIDWIAAGGGPTPELNPISLEQDLALAARVFGNPERGLVLFASGPDAQVQVLDPEPRGDGIDQELGALFSPRRGRDSHYRPAEVHVDRPATVEGTLDALRQELSERDRPLLFYLAGHGEMGESPRENGVPLWGGESLGVEALARVLDAAGSSSRRVRLVITACHSGGFAEIAFAGAEEGSGAARTDRCGLFATTWDLGASGCDPDPDRRRQEGYGIHFLHALEGQDRTGARLASTSVVDVNGDGRIGLLEAHTRARIVSRSLDVPTTTSDRWLRSAAPTSGPTRPVELPEEDAVIAALAPELGLEGAGLAAARSRLDELEGELESIGEKLNEARSREEDASRRVAAELLARWPVIDDPWHPDYERTRAQGREAILAFVAGSPAWADLGAARGATDRLADRMAPLEVASARVERLVRAEETRLLAGRLRAEGGADWARYLRFLECERSVP
ncbi:MAG: hypothetical protein HYY06_31485 [Deltaproteobacteria bacterium]|nr:hypothetical protein [Deltaproteobacteria bacterium]